MIAESADIKFACSQCGQRIVVDKSAAGLTANCPICQGAVTVPYINSRRDLRPRSTTNDALISGRGEFADPGLEETREALFSAVTEHGETQRELDETKKEVERLRALFKKAVDECERITASATHAQAEIKSFQGDRQQLKAELYQTRQRALAAETQLGELAEALANANHENTALRQQIENDLAVSQERLAATETQLAVRERELMAIQAENSEVVQSLAGAQAELAALRIEMTGVRGELECAHHLLNDAAAAEQTLLATRQELQARVEEATAENQRLVREREQLRAQTETLRKDLVGTDSGKELLSLRQQLRELTDEQTRTAAALAERAAEAQSLTTTEQTLRSELHEIRRLRDDAERRAEANSEAQLKKDNDVLRGIVARQNETLGVHFSELRSLRRGRFVLRSVYALFGLGLVALVAFALSIFTHQGIAELFSRLGH